MDILFSYYGAEKLPVAMRPGETPVPIPNTMVKTWTADGTMLGTAWESRWLPDPDYDQGNLFQYIAHFKLKTNSGADLSNYGAHKSWTCSSAG